MFRIHQFVKRKMFYIVQISPIPIIFVAPSVRASIFYILFIFYHRKQVLFTLDFLHYYHHQMRLLLILLMMRDLFSFLQKLNSDYTCTFTSPLQQTLKQDHRASHSYYSVKDILKLLAFKWLLNEFLLDIKWSEVMLIWWFVSISFIRLFLRFSF